MIVLPSLSFISIKPIAGTPGDDISSAVLEAVNVASGESVDFTVLAAN